MWTAGKVAKERDGEGLTSATDLVQVDEVEHLPVRSDVVRTAFERPRRAGGHIPFRTRVAPGTVRPRSDLWWWRRGRARGATRTEPFFAR